MKPSLKVVAPYGPRNASVRARILHWLQRTGLEANLNFFTHESSNRPQDLLRDPLALLRGQRQMAALAGQPSELPLFIVRRATPFSNGGLERKLLSSASFGVYDFDDALFTRSRAGMQMLWSEARASRVAVSTADRVIAGNDLLANWASTYADDVRVIPTCIEPEDYPMKSDFRLGATPSAVWLGSPSTEHYLAGISKALLEAHRAFGLRLHVISGSAGTLGPLDPMVTRLQWSSDSDALLHGFDLAIAPLTDTPWARGKCAYKLLQYGAAGLPTISSPVGVNEAVARGFGHPSATTNEEWSHAIAAVIEAADADRARMGLQARAFVERAYSFSSWESRWLQAAGIESRHG